MKILLDENLPRTIKADFGDTFDVFTVRDMGWHGKKNGELLTLLTSHYFDIFITLDKNLRHQQNLKQYDGAVFLLLSVNNRRETLRKLIDKVAQQIKSGEFKKFNEIKE
ncbi:MAG: DUF5615 family PIN-like protein [Ignavibacteriales bacterium]|nr:DUF5615 family PIN-like protein [Ignavibacteriales bacterium]